MAGSVLRCVVGLACASLLACGGDDERAPRLLDPGATGQRGEEQELEPDPAGRLRGAECPIAIPAGQSASCGRLIVPLRHSQPDGPEIELAVMVFEGGGGEPPVVYLEGGPGGAASLSLEMAFPVFEPLLADRDLVVIDQRGTGYSSPLLDCPELDQEIIGSLPEPEQLPALMEQIGACAEQFIASGVDPAAFSTRENAADVDALREALGYQQWHVLGASYGTRLALDVMRYFPDGVSSVVLDSVLPPDVDLIAQSTPNIAASFGRIFAGCAAQANCAEAYPELESSFYEMLSTLETNPEELGLSDGSTLELDGDTALQLLVALAYSPAGIEVIPEIVTQLWEGDFALVRDAFGQMAEEPAAVPVIAVGMYLSVMCSEYAAFTSEAAIAQAEADLDPTLVALLGSTEGFDYCDAWGVPAAPAAERAPVTSSIPTLTLSGSYDPVTPPTWAETAVATLENGFGFELPGQSHAVFTSACGASLVQAFWEDPEGDVAGACPARDEQLIFTAIPRFGGTASTHLTSAAVQERALEVDWRRILRRPR